MIQIAVGGLLTECNHFGGLPIDMETYAAAELVYGEDMLSISQGVIGGMLDQLKQSGLRPEPLLYASACSGGPMTSDCYQQLRAELTMRLRQSQPVDGVLLALHGSALADGVDDPEGDLLQLARQIVGPEIPIVATLDLHAHVTEQMIHSTDALVAWETYPHHDQYSTGQRAARLMRRILDGHCYPAMAMAKVPVITSAICASTDGDGPFANLMRYTKSIEQKPEVLSTSLFLVHPYMDCPHMGSGGLVITNDNEELAIELANDIAVRYRQQRDNLEPKTVTPAAAIRTAMSSSAKSVILVETADCCGGGAAGDSVATLSALVDMAPEEQALVPVVDPRAAAQCHSASIGSQIKLTLGHGLDPRWGSPRNFTGIVERLHDGNFEYTGGQFAGQTAQMGPTAVFRIGGVSVLITSRATYDYADEQYRAVGLQPAAARFIVAKNPMNFRFAYGDFAESVFVLDTPGPTPATLKHVPFQKLQRPYFPLDTTTEDLAIDVLTRRIPQASNDAR